MAKKAFVSMASGLMVPKGYAPEVVPEEEVVPSTVKIPPRVTREDIFKLACEVVGDGVGPGRVIMLEYNAKEQVSAGGIVKPQNTTRHRSTIYGRVVKSGTFMMNNRTPVDVAGWPLEQGVYVEVVDLNHWDSNDSLGLTIIRAEDVVRWWKTKPAFLSEE